jgi:hypothetical protein
MDANLDSALAGGPLRPPREWNSYRAKLDQPRFNPRYRASFPGEGGDSFLSPGVQEELIVIFENVEAVGARSNVVRASLADIEPTAFVLNSSEFKYTREYFDLKDLDSALGIVPKTRPVLLFTPRAREYCAESGCPIHIVIFRSNIFAAGNTLQMAVQDQNAQIPDDVFYLGAVKHRRVDEFLTLAFNNMTLAERWKQFDAHFRERKVDLMVAEEDPIGRTGTHLIRDFFFDAIFIESIFRGLHALSQGGTALIKFSSLGSRLVADLIYIYAYVFDKITIMKPSTSNAVSQEHYLVAQGFQPSKYFQLNMDNLLDYLFRAQQDHQRRRVDFAVHALLGNLDSALNFTTWLTSINDNIARTIHTNALALWGALDDKQSGFSRASPLLLVDHVRFREALGGVGRTTLHALPEFQTDLQEVEQAVVLTETGQSTFGALQLRDKGPGSEGLNRSFIVYLGLSLVLLPDMLRLPLLASFLPALGSTVGQTRISADVYESKKTSLENNLREWLGAVYALGDIDSLLSVGSGDDVIGKIKELLTSRNWTLASFFGSSFIDGSLPQSALDEFYGQLAILLQRFAGTVKSLLDLAPTAPDNPASRVLLRVTPLDNLRYRLLFCLDGIKYGIAQPQRPGCLGEYELFNLLLPDETSQIKDFQSISALLSQRSFLNRIFNHTSLPIYLGSLRNDAAIPDFYFAYRPDLEFFASATNRHAPYWCSADPADVLLGSQGNFFGEISTPDHHLYRENKVRLAVAFPPSHPQVLVAVLNRCLVLFAALQERLSAASIANKDGGEFALVIFFEDEPVNNNLVSDTVMAATSGLGLLSFGSFNRIYNPHSGEFSTDIKYKALAIKTANHPFSF